MKKLLLLLCIAFATSVIKTEDRPTTYREYANSGGSVSIFGTFGSFYLANAFCSDEQLAQIEKQYHIKESIIPCILFGFLGCLGLWTFLVNKRRQQNNVNHSEEKEKKTKNPSFSCSNYPCMHGYLPQHCYSCLYHAPISHAPTFTAHIKDVPTTYRAYAETEEGTRELIRTFCD